MEKNIGQGVQSLKKLYGTGAYDKTSGYEGDGDGPLKGRPSLFNRYVLFSNRGTLVDESKMKGLQQKAISQNEEVLTDAIKNQNANSNFLAMKNPSAQSLINYFKNTEFPVEYDWGDFLYGKYYGKIPNNHMLTLRRYAGPVEDNVYSSEINSKLDIARVVTWMGEETGNNLKDILGMNFGLKWREVESTVQTDNNQTMNGPIDNDAMNFFGAMGSGQGPADVADNAQRSQDGTDFDKWEQDGFYENRIFGPVDVIDRMQARDRGLEFNQEISITVEYSLRGYGNISPKDALLDVISNILALSYANAPFWGGAVRVREDLRYNKLMGDGDMLKNGDFVGYFSSLINDLGDKFKNIYSGGGDDTADVLKMGAAFGANKIINKFKMRREYQKTKTLLTGEATGAWHLTIGNPLRPIAVIGNLICKDTALEFDNSLGAQDFPTSVKATFTLAPARPRDITDIESMFNAGKGRMYLPGDQAKTILDGASLVQNEFLAGDNDDSGKNVSNQQLADLSNVGFDDRFSKWSNQKGKIANALAFHPVIDRMVQKKK